MNEKELIKKYKEDIPILEAWAKYIQEKICSEIKGSIGFETSLDTFLKLPLKYRTKDEKSLVSKAFTRGKLYANPYDDITDKIGMRFVVLLIRDIRLIKEIIEGIPDWEYSLDRDYEKEREEHPLVFTYQSIHYILRAKPGKQFGGVEIPTGTACEIQIRTLLQHAYSEFSHDTIYKAKTKASNGVHRTLAKSMALIEAVDNYFESAKDSLDHQTKSDADFLTGLTTEYEKYAVPEIDTQTNQYVIESLKPLLDGTQVGTIIDFFNSNPSVGKCISRRFDSASIFRQPVSILIYYLVATKPAQLVRHFPFTREDLRPFFDDMGQHLSL